MYTIEVDKNRKIIHIRISGFSKLDESDKENEQVINKKIKTT